MQLLAVILFNVGIQAMQLLTQDWEGFIQIANSIKVDDDFMSDRDTSLPQQRNLLSKK